MRLTRRAYERDHGPSLLADKELTADSSDSSLPDVKGCACGFDGNEFILGMRGYHDGSRTPWYVLTLTPGEMRVLLSRSLNDAYYHRDEEVPDGEKELWETLFDLWEKRLKRLTENEANTE